MNSNNCMVKCPRVNECSTALMLIMQYSLTIPTLEEAEYNHRKAERIVVELHQLGGMSKEEKMETEFEISTSLSRYYREN